MAWQDKAACKGADLDLFFPADGGRNGYAAARKLCATCPVIYDCLQWAIDTDSIGIFGGMTHLERRRMPPGDMPDAIKLAEGHGDAAGTTKGWYRERVAGVPHCQPCKDAYNKHHYERVQTRKLALASGE